jgi:GNAT superfamily N-acetyltransferase
MWVGPDDFDRSRRIENETRDEVEALTDDGGARYRAFWEWIEASLPDERQWFLDHLAVDERERGRGIGSALVRFVWTARRGTA